MATRLRTSVKTMLFHKHVFDLLQGYAPNDLHLRYAIAPFELPEDLEELVLRVTRRTYLRRRESIAVMEDLAEHLRDGLDHGVSPEELLRDFGNETTTADLIRNSMLRKRPNWAHYVGYGGAFIVTAVILLTLTSWLYLGAHIWFSSPKITVDYIARLNEPLKAIPVNDRAWPQLQTLKPQLFELVAAQLELPTTGEPMHTPEEDRIAREYFSILTETAANKLDGSLEWPGYDPDRTKNTRVLSAELRHSDLLYELKLRDVDPSVVDPTSMSAIESFYERATPLLKELRAYSKLPALGHELRLRDEATNAPPNDIRSTLYGTTSLPSNELRLLGEALAGDILISVRRQDGPQTLEDIETLINLGRLAREQDCVMSNLSAIKLDSRAFQATRDILAVQPDLFTNEQLDELAQILAIPDDQIECSMEYERFAFEDIAQRIYSEDGQLLPDAFVLIDSMQHNPDVPSNIDSTAIAPFALALAPTRTEALGISHAMWDHYEESMRRPRREAPKIMRPDLQVAYAIIMNPPVMTNASTITQYRSFASQFPLNLFLPLLDGFVLEVHETKQQRDAALIAIALEQWRRQHGTWPQELSELLPEFLNAVPHDQFDGKQLRYRVEGSRPLVYSVGNDGRDDNDASNPTLANYSRGDDIILWRGPVPK